HPRRLPAGLPRSYREAAVRLLARYDAGERPTMAGRVANNVAALPAGKPAKGAARGDEANPPPLASPPAHRACATSATKCRHGREAPRRPRPAREPCRWHAREGSGRGEIDRRSDPDA